MNSREGKIFPVDDRDATITCISLTHDFLIYGSEVSMNVYVGTL